MPGIFPKKKPQLKSFSSNSFLKRKNQIPYLVQMLISSLGSLNKEYFSFSSILKSVIFSSVPFVVIWFLNAKFFFFWTFDLLPITSIWSTYFSIHYPCIELFFSSSFPAFTFQMYQLYFLYWNSMWCFCWWMNGCQPNVDLHIEYIRITHLHLF